MWQDKEMKCFQVRKEKENCLSLQKTWYVYGKPDKIFRKAKHLWQEFSWLSAGLCAQSTNGQGLAARSSCQSQLPQPQPMTGHLPAYSAGSTKL